MFFELDLEIKLIFLFNYSASSILLTILLIEVDFVVLFSYRSTAKMDPSQS